MSTRYAIFCADPLNDRSVEPDFAAEADAAREQGFSVVVLDHDALDHRTSPALALKRTRLTGPGNAVYRGWMLRSEAYQALHDELLGRGVRLIVEPDAYRASHHAPVSYPALSDFMPHTSWVESERLNDESAVKAALSGFGTSAVVIKDWVKSQAAGYWNEACFIPHASDYQKAGNVISRFRELQGDSLVGGIVIKAYVPLVPLGEPADEYRVFLVDGRVVGCWPRSSAAEKHLGPSSDLLRAVAERIPSRFASADFGVDTDGRWWLLEIGDGHVSGLPSAEVATPLFQALSGLADVSITD